MNTLEMEIALMRYFNFMQKIIVPNVKFGMVLNSKELHECDLLICTKSGYLTEVEIKISKQDLIKDKEKPHGHFHDAIKYLYFAIPKEMKCDIDHIPERAGILLVTQNGWCQRIREPVYNKSYKLSDKEQHKLACLGTMRIYTLKKRILNKSIKRLER